MLCDYKYYNNHELNKYNKIEPIKKSLIACFSLCNNLKEINLDFLKTENLISIRSMCKNCKNLEKISMRKWNVKKLRNCDFAFADCKNLKYIIIDWENINENINCYLTLYNSKPLIISDNFKFDINTKKPCEF